MQEIFAWSFHHTLKWLGVLGGSLLFTVGGVLLPAVLRNRIQPRSHHRAKLLNECLAKIHVAFAAYFLSFLASADYEANLGDFIKPLIIAVLATSAIFYFFGILSFLDQDLTVIQLHNCNSMSSGSTQNPVGLTVLERCRGSLSFFQLMKLCGKNIIFGLILLGVGFATSFLRMPAK